MISNEDYGRVDGLLAEMEAKHGNKTRTVTFTKTESSFLADLCKAEAMRIMAALREAKDNDPSVTADVVKATILRSITRKFLEAGSQE